MRYLGEVNSTLDLDVKYEDLVKLVMFHVSFSVNKNWLWPSASHFKEVTVTLSQVTVTLK